MARFNTYKRIFEQSPFMHRVHWKWQRGIPYFGGQNCYSRQNQNLYPSIGNKVSQEHTELVCLASLRLRKVNKVKWILRVYRKWLDMMEIGRIDHPRVWWSITLPKVLLAQVYLSWIASLAWTKLNIFTPEKSHMSCACLSKISIWRHHRISVQQFNDSSSELLSYLYAGNSRNWFVCLIRDVHSRGFQQKRASFFSTR